MLIQSQDIELKCMKKTVKMKVKKWLILSTLGAVNQNNSTNLMALFTTWETDSRTVFASTSVWESERERERGREREREREREKERERERLNNMPESRFCQKLAIYPKVMLWWHGQCIFSFSYSRPWRIVHDRAWPWTVSELNVTYLAIKPSILCWRIWLKFYHWWFSFWLGATVAGTNPTVLLFPSKLFLFRKSHNVKAFFVGFRPSVAQSLLRRKSDVIVKNVLRTTFWRWISIERVQPWICPYRVQLPFSQSAYLWTGRAGEWTSWLPLSKRELKGSPWKGQMQMSFHSHFLSALELPVCFTFSLTQVWRRTLLPEVPRWFLRGRPHLLEHDSNDKRSRCWKNSSKLPKAQAGKRRWPLLQEVSQHVQWRRAFVYKKVSQRSWKKTFGIGMLTWKERKDGRFETSGMSVEIDFGLKHRCLTQPANMNNASAVSGSSHLAKLKICITCTVSGHFSLSGRKMIQDR